MRAGFSILLLISIRFLQAQNLVPNPGFEQYHKCPGSFTSTSRGEIAPGWTSPTSGTPDMFHTCSIGDAGVPANWAGYSKAYSGSGYAGIYAFMFSNTKDYREYLQTQLTTPLDSGDEYLVEFYYKLSSYSKYSIDRIGFLLSDSTHRIAGDEVFPIKATYERINRTIYSRATGLWTRFAYVHKARGGEKFLTIGNFSNQSNTRHQYIQNSQASEPMLARAAYFFIDDVNVVKVGGKPAEAPVLSGYPELKTNFDYVLNNIQFEYNDYTLLELSYAELKKVVAIMRYHKDWSVVISGHTDDIGSEGFNLELSLNRAASVAHYLTNQGIDSSRIKTQGFGKKTPLVTGIDEASRAINRRVEIRFLN